jgi:subtilisin family serine protease
MGLFRVLAQRYDDPYFSLQHGIRSMQIDQAHQWARGQGVEIAVIDTGVDVTHPELEERIADAQDFVADSSQSFAADIHGTAVAGVIASAANNGIGIVGVAPAVKILALKACWPLEPGSVAALCSSFTLAKAISFAISKRPDVLNLSLAGPPDPLLSRLLSRAIDRGIIVISAADPELGGRPGFPSALDRVIIVSTAGSDGWAVTPDSVAAVRRLIAPGDEILTTMPYGTYDFLSGSSLAAAHVSGLVALLLERNRDLSVEQILALLRETGGASERGVNGCVALAHLMGSGTCLEPGMGKVPRPSREGS